MKHDQIRLFFMSMYKKQWYEINKNIYTQKISSEENVLHNNSHLEMLRSVRAILTADLIADTC